MHVAHVCSYRGRGRRYNCAPRSTNHRIIPLAHLVDLQVDVDDEAQRGHEEAGAEGVVSDARVLRHLREELLVGELDVR